ncbi:Disease resistance protein RPM1 [Hordeum vulgare]|nr:Disease resistance protein RPM1 [Hordeum vulgare]
MTEIADGRDLHAGPWPLVGDFNLLVNTGDKSNANINRRMLARFKALLNRLELKELYLNGRRYTWSNERRLPTLEKIDHIFVTNSWEDLYPSTMLTALRSAISDHYLLLLDLDAEFSMGRRFRFESFWPTADGLMQTVAEAWQTIPYEGNPFLELDNKLHETAKALQRWSDRFIGNIRLQISIAMEVILCVDAAAESRVLTEREHDLRKLLNKKLLGLSSLD